MRRPASANLKGQQNQHHPLLPLKNGTSKGSEEDLIVRGLAKGGKLGSRVVERRGKKNGRKSLDQPRKELVNNALKREN